MLNSRRHDLPNPVRSAVRASRKYKKPIINQDQEEVKPAARLLRQGDSSYTLASLDQEL